MSNIVIARETRDLTEWLKEHDVKIILRRTVGWNTGWAARFNKLLVGVTLAAEVGRGDNRLEAVLSLLGGVYGRVIGFNGPAHVDVPVQFTKIEQAVLDAEEAS